MMNENKPQIKIKVKKIGINPDDFFVMKKRSSYS